MNAKKQKEKERRRARKQADEAWEAVEAGNLGLAEKIIRRAVKTQPDNARLWNDQGVIQNLLGNDGEADRCFRYAIRLARNFAAPYHHLAALRAKEDRLDDAVALEADALKHAPDNDRLSLDHTDGLEFLQRGILPLAIENSQPRRTRSGDPTFVSGSRGSVGCPARSRERETECKAECRVRRKSGSTRHGLRT